MANICIYAESWAVWNWRNASHFCIFSTFSGFVWPNDEKSNYTSYFINITRSTFIHHTHIPGHVTLFFIVLFALFIQPRWRVDRRLCQHSNGSKSQSHYRGKKPVIWHTHIHIHAANVSWASTQYPGLPVTKRS